MTIADQITRLQNAKAAIKQSIENKGVEVRQYAKLNDYASFIDKIQIASDDTNFYDVRTKGSTTYRGLFAYYVGDIDISLYDSKNITDMTYMFYQCGDSKSTITNLETLDFSSVKSAYYMFGYYGYLAPINLSGKSFPMLTDGGHMFYNISNAETIDLSNADFPNLKESQNMFYFGYSGSVTTLNLAGVNMPSLTRAESMFEYGKMTTLDVSGINFSKVGNVGSLFANCKQLVEIIGELDFSGASNGLYNSAYNNPFRLCNALETVWVKNIYKDCTMKNEAKWSINLSETKIKDECLIYMINELPDLINDKGLTATDKIVLTLPPTNTLTAEQVQSALNKGWQVANTNF